MRTFHILLACLLLLFAARGLAIAEDAHKHDGHAHDDTHKHDEKDKDDGDEDVEAMFEEEDDHDDHDHDDHKGHDHDEHADEVVLTKEAIDRNGIVVAKVGCGALKPTFVAPGRVAFNAEAMAHVGSALTGRVIELKAKLGDVVKQGDELLIIESPELAEAQSTYMEKRTAVIVAKATVEPAQQAYDRARKLHEKNEGIALAEVQKREADAKAAEGALITAEASAVAGRNTLQILGMDDAAIDKLVQTGKVSALAVIRSPIAGTIIEREVTLGELVTPDRDALIAVADLSTLWIIADVPESRVAHLKVGSKAIVRVASLPKGHLDGKVGYIGAALDPDTRSAAVRVEVSAADGTLRPGMFARIELIAGEPEVVGAHVPIVPEDAVMTVEGETSVFVPVENEPYTFARKAVKVGLPVGGMVPIKSGIDEGDEVVTKGVFILKAELGKSAAGHGHDH